MYYVIFNFNLKLKVQELIFNIINIVLPVFKD